MGRGGGRERGEDGFMSTLRHLVQVLLPLHDNAGTPYDDALYEEVAVELTHRFGGMTAYTRAPAQGRWKTDDSTVSADKLVVSDDVVVVEVIVDELDEAWWRAFRERQQKAFQQRAMIVRAHVIQLF